MGHLFWVNFWRNPAPIDARSVLRSSRCDKTRQSLNGLRGPPLGRSPRYRCCCVVIVGPIRDFGILHGPLFADPWVHAGPPCTGKQRQNRHNRIAIWQLRRLRLSVILQQRKSAGWFIVMVRMALQIDKNPI